MIIICYFSIGILAAIICTAMCIYEDQSPTEPDNVYFIFSAIVLWPVHLIFATVLASGTVIGKVGKKIFKKGRTNKPEENVAV